MKKQRGGKRVPPLTKSALERENHIKEKKKNFSGALGRTRYFHLVFHCEKNRKRGVKGQLGFE